MGPHLKVLDLVSQPHKMPHFPPAGPVNFVPPAAGQSRRLLPKKSRLVGVGECGNGLEGKCTVFEIEVGFVAEWCCGGDGKERSEEDCEEGTEHGLCEANGRLSLILRLILVFGQCRVCMEAY
jgi:hypothetical protein